MQKNGNESSRPIPRYLQDKSANLSKLQLNASISE